VVTAERFQADELICDDPARAAELCDIGERTSVVIALTRRSMTKALRAVVDTPAAFIGMIGSVTKVRTILRGFATTGSPPSAWTASTHPSVWTSVRDTG
jgi:xanthine/CO dehydrogenase XdhC/CoxF family maturation factor